MVRRIGQEPAIGDLRRSSVVVHRSPPVSGGVSDKSAIYNRRRGGLIQDGAAAGFRRVSPESTIRNERRYRDIVHTAAKRTASPRDGEAIQGGIIGANNATTRVLSINNRHMRDPIALIERGFSGRKPSKDLYILRHGNDRIDSGAIGSFCNPHLAPSISTGGINRILNGLKGVGPVRSILRI